MKFNGFDLTGEQENVVDCIKSGEDTKVQAPAGAGKTFVLEAAASVIPEKKGLYLAFNKAIVTEASKKFGSNVEVRTGHSVAYRATGREYINRLGKLTGWQTCNFLGITKSDPFPTVSSRGYLILDTLRNFCYSNDPRITYRNVPKLKGNYKTIEAMREAQKIVAEDTANLWEQMIDPNSSIPITHDFYLKLWALSKPIIEKDFILLDEAQDSNPVILGILENQTHAQKIYVGDQFQQIYAWRGAINAMQRIQTKHSPYLTQSFRFGPAVADLASDILTYFMPPDLAPPRIRGFKERKSEISYSMIQNPDCVICRTNNGVITNIFKYLEKGKEVYVQGGTKQTENLLKGAKDLMNGKSTWVPDLALFKTWAEVLEYAGSEIGGDLRGLVNLVKKYSIDEIMATLQSTQQSAKNADVVLTTAHKFKGLEASKVQLYSDFPNLETNEAGETVPMTQADTNLIYTSVTRSLDMLDISQCPVLHPETFHRAAKYWGSKYREVTNKRPKIIKTSDAVN
jgi:hypothetical protein